MNLKASPLVKRDRQERGHAVQFHLYDVQGQAKLICGAGCENSGCYEVGD